MRLCLLVVLAVCAVACRKPAPAPVSFEFVDGEGAPWGEALGVRLTHEGDDAGVYFTWTSGSVVQVLAPGAWRLEAKRTLPPAPPGMLRCGTIERPVRLETAFTVSGAATERFQIGPSKLELLANRTANRVGQWLETRTVRLSVRGVDGGASAFARARCNYRLFEADDEGRVECEVREPEVDVRVFNGAEWAELHLDGGVDEAAVQLQPGMQVRGTLAGVDAGEKVHFTINSKRQMRDEWSPGPEFRLEGLVDERAIVCAYGSSGGVCDVVMPDAGSDQQVAWVPGGAANVVLRVTHHGQLVSRPVLYLNRSHFDATPVDGGVSLLVTPGRNLLVVNAIGTPDRDERIVTAAPGETVFVESELRPP